MADRAATTPEAKSRRRVGWYLWDYDRCEVVRGPYPNSGEAGAVRTEMELHEDDDRNLWIVYSRTLELWEAERG